VTAWPALVLLRAVAWPAVLGLAAAAALVGGVGVGLGPASTGATPLAAAGALLAAAAAFTMDEASAPVVDITPTSRARRAAVRAYALSIPLLAGTLLVILAHARNPALSTTALAVAVVGDVLLGFAVACTTRRRHAEPGTLAATTITVTLVVAPLLNPIARHVQLFPGSPTATVSSNTWWSLAIASSLLTIAATTHARVGKRRLRAASLSSQPCRSTCPRDTHSTHPTDHAMTSTSAGSAFTKSFRSR
jgi:hypothetical protein